MPPQVHHIPKPGDPMVSSSPMAWFAGKTGKRERRPAQKVNASTGRSRAIARETPAWTSRTGNQSSGRRHNRPYKKGPGTHTHNTLSARSQKKPASPQNDSPLQPHSGNSRMG